MKNLLAGSKIQSLIIYPLLILIGLFGGYILGTRGYSFDFKAGPIPVEITGKEPPVQVSVDFTRFWQVWNDVSQNHISKPIDQNALLEGAISGMVDAIGDPYTTYLNPTANEVALSSLNGQYQGIGAQLGFDDQERLIIVAPLDGSPAKSSGVKAGDRIVEIEGESAAGISITEAVNKIRGEAGTVITLTLAREGVEDVFEIKIVRDTITLESVTWEDKGDGIAYIRLSRFGSSTNEDWISVVNEVITQMPNLNGVVLDVRSNPGGFLESSVFIASEFIDSGLVVRQEFSNGQVNDFKVNRKGRLTSSDLNIAVLIDEGSASASEIVAAAVKEKAEAILVGKRSFGKGSVQKSDEYPDGAALHVTIAKWLTPDGNWIDSVNSKFADSEYNEIGEDGKEIKGGLKPDFIVEITDEDIQNSYDRQSEEAVRILKEGFPEKALIDYIKDLIPVKL